METMTVLIPTYNDYETKTEKPLVAVGDKVLVSPWTNSCLQHYAISSAEQVGNPEDWKPAIVLQVFHSYDVAGYGNWFARVHLV